METFRNIPPWHSSTPRHRRALLLVFFFCVATVVVVLALVLGLTIGLLLLADGKSSSSSKESDPSVPRANLGYATYRGTLVGAGAGAGVAQYLGLRYAAPPLGERRFRRPVDPESDSESGRRDVRADTFGPICLGISQPYPYPNVDQDEDCLFANVWAPANATLESKLPVWLFIQGGGYTVNSNANWNGTAVVERSGHRIVLVNFNYRVGLWGFLASGRVRADGDLNVGLLDQRAAMRWVHRHIAQFGGDPHHVVIHGASAGAGSVALHLIANDTNAEEEEEERERLFVGAVGESVFFPAQPFVHELEWQFDLVLKRTGCDGNYSESDEAIACLRGKPTEVLQAANVPAAFPGAPAAPDPLFFWTPCVDGALLPDLPYRLFDRGAFVDVPVIMGSTTDEGTVFATDASTRDQMATFLQSNYPLLSTLNTSAVLERYPQMGSLPNHAAWFPSTAKAYGEATFTCPVSHILNSYTRYTNTSRAWGYRYDVRDAENEAAGLGVPHIFESWAIFGPDSPAGPGRGPRGYYTYNSGVVPVMMDYWISFVRTLDPSTLRFPGTPTWTGWGCEGKRLLVRTGNVSIERAPDDQEARCAFWKALAPVMRQ
ncbi:alpha/beta-hydrolase [Xylaria acuta]|nr:alpha/beta-hydrolase [Xylaria acuta]